MDLGEFAVVLDLRKVAAVVAGGAEPLLPDGPVADLLTGTRARLVEGLVEKWGSGL